MPYGTVNADVIQTSTTGGILGAGNASIMKNRIINGAMVIDQRNAGATVTPNNSYTLDRWFALNSQTSKFAVQQNANSATPPIGFTKFLGVQSSSAYSVLTGDYFSVGQRIEGFNIADLGWGTANAKTITLSFQVQSSLTGTFGGSLRNGAGNRSYPFTYTISSASTWTSISITIAGDTTGTWSTDNSTGIEVDFGLGAGSTYSGTAGSWSAGNYVTATGAVSVVGTNGATFYITGVQLEVGSSATGFEYVNYQTSLANCQRYTQVLTAMALGRTANASTCGASFMAPVVFRTTPTASNITYTMSAGATGTGATYAASPFGMEFYNSSANWTTNAVCQVTATLSAEL